MENHFFLADKLILAGYFLGMIALGACFRKRSGTPEGFMIASGRLPGWAVGLSILGTFVSSVTFLAYPGQAYNTNWDAFVFSLTLPAAALAATLFFIPLYRTRVNVSAYEYMEQRFGTWARIYGSLGFMFGSLARIGMILFLVSLVLHSLTGWPHAAIIVVTGIGVTFYTMAGGIEAVIWTDVIQVIVLLAGALFAVVLLLGDIPGGFSRVIEEGARAGKFSLGSWRLDLAAPTAWVVLLYGIVENLRNFGVDQNYVQRYQTTRSTREAARSVWFAALAYIPLSLLFLFIGTALWVFYRFHPDLLPQALAAAGKGDKIFPHFIATQFPAGLRGLLVAALMAAAMSSIDSSLNSVSTLTLMDFYKRFSRRDVDDRRAIGLLRIYTLAWGVLGTAAGLAMIRVQSALETTWQLGGIAGGGVIGLFLLGLLFKKARGPHAALAVAASVAAISWATFARGLPGGWKWFECPWHPRMIAVVGTLTLLAVGTILAGLGALLSRKE